MSILGLLNSTNQATALTNYRLSEIGYELGTRQPDLLVLLRYARLAGVSTDVLIDDKLKLPGLRKAHYLRLVEVL